MVAVRNITKTGWLGIMKMDPSGAPCLPMECFSEEDKNPIKGVGQEQSGHQTIVSSNGSCSRHDIYI